LRAIVRHGAPRPRRQAARAAAIAALLLCAVAPLAGCGGSGSATAASSIPASADVGESARSDTCAQWQAGTVTQRYGALARLKKFAESPVGSSALLKNGHILDDKQAYKLFGSICAHRFARAFKLYKLYERAAAFVGHAAT
jgi:hypothetical protein